MNARLRIALTAVAMALTACSVTKPTPPLTEPGIRARFNDAQTTSALAKIDNPLQRDLLRRHFEERAQSARGRGLRLALDDVRIGEHMTLGGGMALERTFALYHEYSERGFTTYVEGIESLGGRVQGAYREPIGGSTTGLAAIELVELNRVILRRYAWQASDPRCCPTQLESIGFMLTGTTLEAMR